MCLHIDSLYHGKGNSNVKGYHIAAFPILVWKVLERRGTAFKSPFMCKMYHFKKEYSSEFSFNASRNKVEAGLHAYYSFEYAQKGVMSWGYDAYIFPSIIPIGAKFFIGSNGEIASSKLIVYRDGVELEAVHGSVRHTGESLSQFLVK